MARTYFWTRAESNINLAASTRARWIIGALHSGNVLERFIFNFELQHQFTEGLPPAPPGPGAMVFGVVLRQATLPAPDFDPINVPLADWLWAGQITMTDRHRTGYTGVGFDCLFTGPPAQFDVTTRRKPTVPGSDDLLWLVSRPVSFLGAGDNSWGGHAFGSVLESSP